MNDGYLATRGGGAYDVIPASVYIVSPGGAYSYVGGTYLPATFPFGVPYTVSGVTYVAVPATTVVVTASR